MLQRPLGEDMVVITLTDRQERESTERTQIFFAPNKAPYIRSYLRNGRSIVIIYRDIYDGTIDTSTSFLSETEYKAITDLYR